MVSDALEFVYVGATFAVVAVFGLLPLLVQFPIRRTTAMEAQTAVNRTTR
jgi:hypothetical protein